MSILSVMIGSGHELIRRKAEILFGCREHATSSGVGANTFFAPTEKTTSQPTEAQTREQHPPHYKIRSSPCKTKLDPLSDNFRFLRISLRVIPFLAMNSLHYSAEI